MQTISDELAELLTSKLQAGPSGFRGRIEVDEPVPQVIPVLVQHAFGAGGTEASVAFASAVTPGNLLVLSLGSTRGGDTPAVVTAGWTLVHRIDGGTFKFSYRWLEIWSRRWRDLPRAS